MPDLSAYYSFLVRLMDPLRQPLTDWSASIQIPILLALVLGLLGALSPCQLSTNLAALVLISRDVTDQKRVARSAAAYVLGKVVVYSAVGGAAILLGLELARVSVPIVVWTRRALGPVLILLGLVMLGVVRFSIPYLHDIASNLRERFAVERDARGSFLLGFAFAFAACPTLFVLFFGALIPLAIAAAPEGITFPAIFALGTAAPLLLLVGLLALGTQRIHAVVNRLRAADVWVTRLAGVVFMLIGVNEILLYWFLR